MSFFKVSRPSAFSVGSGPVPTSFCSASGDDDEAESGDDDEAEDDDEDE